MSAYLALDIPLGEIDSVISDVSDPLERATLIDALGGVLFALHQGIVVPVTNQYPELGPRDE